MEWVRAWAKYQREQELKKKSKFQRFKIWIRKLIYAEGEKP